MSDSMVERVAKAINAGGMAWLNENDPKRMSLSWADVPDDVFAKAALSELLTPSTAMLIAGVRAMRVDDLDVTEKELALGWRAMISKAMEE
jgi:hypothetical protein